MPNNDGSCKLSTFSLVGRIKELFKATEEIKHFFYSVIGNESFVTKAFLFGMSL